MTTKEKNMRKFGYGSNAEIFAAFRKQTSETNFVKYLTQLEERCSERRREERNESN